MWKFSYSFRIMAIFYSINWIVAVETIEWGKLFKGGNYSRKYGILNPNSYPWFFVKINKFQIVFSFLLYEQKSIVCGVKVSQFINWVLFLLWIMKIWNYCIVISNFHESQQKNTQLINWDTFIYMCNLDPLLCI